MREFECGKYANYFNNCKVALCQFCAVDSFVKVERLWAKVVLLTLGKRFPFLRLFR